MISFLQGIDYIKFIPFITLVMLVAGTITAILSKPLEFKDTRIAVFFSVMGSMAVIILAFNVYVSTVNLETQRTDNAAHFTKETIDKLWLYPNKLLTEKPHARPEFLASLYYNNQTLYNLTKDVHNIPTINSELDEQYISILLIQCWEDYLTLRTLEHTGDEVWLCNFLQWAQSPFLKKNFDRLKYNFAATTIKLGQLLFEYSSNLPIPTPDPELYRTTVNKLLDDQRLKDIFIERSQK
jgi:hypothetical protein